MINRRSKLKNHRVKEMYACEGCGWTGGKGKILVTFDDADEFEFQCPECNSTFIYQQSEMETQKVKPL
jgi:predicted RNA-binding Zn-ribbon protein involved in translation (DUF1610 family)